MASAVRGLMVLCLMAPAAAGAPQAEPEEGSVPGTVAPAMPGDLEQDDECSASGDCAFAALQRRASAATGGTIADETAEGAVVQPALQGDTDGVSVENMGIDELVHAVTQGNLPAADLAKAQELLDGLEQQVAALPADNATALLAEGSDEELAGCSSRSYSGRRGGSEYCFCQLSHNPDCHGCSCPQGCRGVTWEHGSSVSFKNKARADGCRHNAVLLTSPKAYYADPHDLASSGYGCSVSIISDLLRSSFNSYQHKVAPGSVWQCFHASRVASVRYLHLQTFCSGGNFHGMPTRNTHVAHCVKMSSSGQASSLASQLAHQIR